MAHILLDERSILITGASSGIGAATAVACAKRGMAVALVARRAEKLEELGELIRSTGGRAVEVACDVADAAACEEAVERTREAFGGVYAVFANAGYGYEAPAIEETDERLRRIFEVNFFGSTNIIRPSLALMREAGEGHVLLCSSILSKFTLPHYSAYSATKAAQDHLGRALRFELKGSGIYCSTVHPVSTQTEFFDGVRERSEIPRKQKAERKWPKPQTSERVAAAVVDTLVSPKGEVWTSFTGRMAAALVTACPGLGDRLLLRASGRKTDKPKKAKGGKRRGKKAEPTPETPSPGA